VVLVATGSEVELAVAVRGALEAQGIGADVVSMPSMSRSWRRTPPGAPMCCPPMC
jgi:transketolase